jgi:DNA-cytosine methyltransferase
MIKVFETFAGIGSQTKALKNIGVEHEVVAISEWDISSLIAYDAVHNSHKSIVVPQKDGKPDLVEIKQFLSQFTFSLDGKKPIKSLNNLKTERLVQLYIAQKRNNNLGSIVNLKLENLPEHDLLTYSFPCFTEGHLVMTHEGYKKIEDIQTGDRVLTHTNQFKSVVTPMKKQTSLLYKVNSMASEELLVTPEHPFYIKSMTQKHTYSIINGKKERKIIRTFSDATWKEAKDLEKNDYLGIAINQVEQYPEWTGCIDNHWGHQKQVNTLSELFTKEAFWWMVGRYMVDGWTCEFNNKQYSTIICTSKKVHEMNDIETKLNELSFNFSKVEETTTVKYHICHKELTVFLQQFGQYTYGKKLTATILNLPKKELSVFLDGYFSADCSINKQDLLSSFSVSKELLYGIGACIAKAYHRPFAINLVKRASVYKTGEKLINQKDYWQLRFKKTQDLQEQAFYENNYIWIPFRHSEKIIVDPVNVYNFEVEGDNSYTVNNLVVHNCQAISLQGKRGGFEKNSGTSSSLLWEVEKILNYLADNNKLPTFLLMENVANLFSSKFIDGFKIWVKFLDELGYDTTYETLTASEFNCPQNRKRAFAVSVLRSKNTLFNQNKFKFPIGSLTTKTLHDILDNNIASKYYKPELTKLLSKKQHKKKISGIHSTELENYTSFQSENMVYFTDGISPTITASGAQSRIKIFDDAKQEVRYLTPAEHWKIMGFTEEDFKLAHASGITETLLKKQAGNSISVQVLESIFSAMFKV